MSLPNSLALRSTHSHRGGRGGRLGGGLGRSLSGSVSTRHSPALASTQLVLHQQQLLDRGGVLVWYLPWPWHIPHLPGP